MNLKNKLIEIEIDLDNKVKELKIWSLSFQTVLSCLLLSADTIDRSKGNDTAIDFCSRLSYLYNIVKNNANKSEVTSTTEAILLLKEEYISDINFLIAYAHFSLLMPQIHRDTILPIEYDGGKIKLDYACSKTEYAELIDKLYSFISLQTMITYNKEEELRQYLLIKAQEQNQFFTNIDAHWVKEMSVFFKKYLICIEILPSDLLEKLSV